MLSAEQIETLEQTSIQETIAWLSQHFQGQIVFSTSLGQEDQVITHDIFANKLPVDVFTLDTGRLFNEAYDLLAQTEARYKKRIRVLVPDAAAVQTYVEDHGINGFYHSVDSRKLCCKIRKVDLLNKALANAKVWITGLRADQSENRSDMRMIEWDDARKLYKYNPLIHWTHKQVEAYLAQHQIPQNVLHKKGYISIGCAPCTRPIEAGEPHRNGRWWWETSHKECGLHETSQQNQT